MFGILTSEQVQHLLQQQILGRLGCYADGLTYVVPISYAYKDQYIYCYTFEGLKISMLRKNKKVCFQVDNTTDMSNWQSVVCWGEYEEITTDIGKTEALAILNARNFPMHTSQKMHINAEWPFKEDDISRPEGVFFRIRVEELTGRYETADIRELTVG